MKNTRIEHDHPPESLIQALANRDAALWIGPAKDATLAESLSDLVGLPWKLVLFESSNPTFIAAIESRNEGVTILTRKRGFLHLVASDPEGIQLPPRSLPVFLLNGRDNATETSESSNLRGFAMMRRRLNMINELVVARPKLVLLVGFGEDQPLKDFVAIWNDDGFRALTTLLSGSASDVNRVDEWLLESNAPPAIDHYRASIPQAASELRSRLSVEIPDDRLVVRTLNEEARLVDVDVTECELIDRPISDQYDLIQARDLRLLQPDELSKEEFESFFNKSEGTWKPYAAGLPWKRDGDARKKLLDALHSAAKNGPSENLILSIISEAGAGGTTVARSLAFEAACEGFPTLVARLGCKPDLLELSSFLYRAHLKAAETNAAHASDKIATAARAFEVPWLIVFDVSHWEAKYDELRNFLKALTKEGRPVVIMAVNSPFVPAELSSNSRIRRLANVTYDLSLQDALKLGVHLNKFLRTYGQAKTPHQWQSFWEAHRPQEITASVAHFWIALEFWLKGQLDITQSIQAWLYNSFTAATLSDEARILILEIAALSVERQPLPEGLMPPTPKEQIPFSVLLERVRATVPALALIRESLGDRKIWVMAHDLLGRYLINSTFFDHSMLRQLRLDVATDPVELRLMLLRRVACRPALALPPFRRLALEFPIRILKLDAYGNQEFIPKWRTVLEILMGMPPGVRETSRVFNHHVAVSLRRVAKQREFDIGVNERKALLERAIAHLERALTELENQDADFESNLNLFNSIALAYQDLADVEREAGAPAERIESLRRKATEATNKALQEDPTNSYVLETTAKNLIQNGELHPDVAATSAAEALGYIYQAVSVERSDVRQNELTRLANRALGLLRSQNAKREIQRLAKLGNPFGALAEAWNVLTNGLSDDFGHDLHELPKENVQEALRILEEAPGKSNWMLLRFRYDLTCVSNPLEFAHQVRLLDELEGTGYRMPLQIQLEHSILLHQEGRHMEANRKFRQLRRDLRQFDAIVEVPQRLFWLRATREGGKRICDARVVESFGVKAMAKVRNLKDELVPFIPQEFGVQNMRPGFVFKCCISFGRNGPFIKPPEPV